MKSGLAASAFGAVCFLAGFPENRHRAGSGEHFRTGTGRRRVLGFLHFRGEIVLCRAGHFGAGADTVLIFK
ncbi:hypothetical protein ACFYY8_03235 [Streptosporangium sp. NPDC001559]|uniref:hypothetical protein n=1 Tax=Streptosporangium sp. NPDC001559 TaxID=3366187 RepID=UPI0036E3CDC5